MKKQVHLIHNAVLQTDEIIIIIPIITSRKIILSCALFYHYSTAIKGKSKTMVNFENCRRD